VATNPIAPSAANRPSHLLNGLFCIFVLPSLIGILGSTPAAAGDYRTAVNLDPILGKHGRASLTPDSRNPIHAQIKIGRQAISSSLEKKKPSQG
jgi:hypothetical protein